MSQFRPAPWTRDRLVAACMSKQNLVGSIRSVVVGKPRDLADKGLFHKVSLVAILAWVGLGADGLSSSCYGPEETFKALGAHPELSIFVAFACVVTIAVICASYRQIIELFPTGGGGYLVASKLLSPKAGVVSGSALLVDYVLTITISIASGADALFSLLPVAWLPYKFWFACFGIIGLTVLNLRGVKESVLLWVPVFFLFVASHAVAILYTVGIHVSDIGVTAARITDGVKASHTELGLLGMGALLLRAFSVGAGTYTGIEAVSNGLPILREPKVQTGKRTMTYMGLSLAATVFGLLLAYMLQGVSPREGKTLNAVLFTSLTANWPPLLGQGFVLVCMVSSTVLLFMAAQAGFLDGPRVLASMAIDRWFPARFAVLSDRFVTANGILLMGAAALVALFLTHGSVGLLVVLYSINVFLTFSLSQLGMVMHWWRQRNSGTPWKWGLAVNATGLTLTGGILAMLIFEKFSEGGWVTLLVTSGVVAVAFLIHRHYRSSTQHLARLNGLVAAVATDPGTDDMRPAEGRRRTAIVLVNGFNGLGLHTFFGIFRMFPRTFSHFVFIEVGLVDAGTFKGAEELDHLREATRQDAAKYVQLCQKYGLTAEARTAISVDLTSTVQELTGEVLASHPQAVVFGGQLAFAHETVWTRWLHNFVVFNLQRMFCRQGTPFVIVPVRV